MCLIFLIRFIQILELALIVKHLKQFNIAHVTENFYNSQRQKKLAFKFKKQKNIKNKNRGR